jgi:hypothetical protein
MPNRVTSIDRDQLDVEIYGHSELYEEWAQELAKAEAAEAQWEAYLSVVKADTLLAVTRNPKLFKLDKTNIPAINAIVTSHPDVTEANDKVLAARAKVKMIQATVRALEHRKTMLTKAADLELMGFHSVPKPSAESRKVLEEGGKRSARQPLKKHE